MHQRQRLLCAFKVALWLTAVTLAGCGWALISVRYGESRNAAWWLGGGYGAFVICLLAYVGVAAQIFRPLKDSEK